MAEEEQQTTRPLRIEKFFLVVCLFATLFLILLSSLWTESSLFFTFLGFLPLLATIGLLLVVIEQSLKDVVYWGIPFLTSLVFLVVFGLLNPLMNYQLDVGGLTVVNLIFGLIVVLVVTLLEGRRLLPEEETEEVTADNMDEFLHGIEARCKALNFVIGRVYRMSNGGTEKLRARLRIEKEWYNEFHSLSKDLDQNKDEALAVLHKIHDRLQLLLKKEKEVLHKKEMDALKNVSRDENGQDRVIDVLMTNDRDPVQSYFVGALEGTQKLIKAIEKY